MQYKFVNNTVRAHGHENSRFSPITFAGVELVKYAECFFGKFYKWLVMLSKYTFDS